VRPPSGGHERETVEEPGDAEECDHEDAESELRLTNPVA
jgi:hypothetical protein